jgi:zinc protease
VAAITKAQADDYYATYYAPQNLTAILVGDFDPAQALALARRYLGAIPRATRPVPEMITTEPAQRAEKRFHGEIESNPGVRARWHTVAYAHRDVPALAVLEEALNGTAGRLQRNLVLGGIANRARASTEHRKYEGMFEIEAECSEGKTPEELERAVHAEIEAIARDGLSAEELQSVKNRYLAGTYRQLTSNFFLLLRYGVAEGRSSWRDADRIDREVQAVTAADVQRVARTYFAKHNRAVAIWTRKAGAGGEDPAIAALPERAKGMVKQILTRIDGAKDAGEVQQILGRMEQMSAQTPPEMKPALDLIRSKAEARIAELSGSK